MQLKLKELNFNFNYRYLVVFCLLISTLFCLQSCRERDDMITWTQVDSHTNQPIFCVTMLTPDTGYAFGGDRFFYGLRMATYDGGKTWRSDSMYDKSIRSAFFLDRHNGIVTGQNGFFFTTNDAGATWQFHQEQGEFLQAIAFADFAHGIAVGGESYHRGRMMTYNGFELQSSIDSTRHELHDIAFSSASTATLVGYGTIQRTTDMGKTWQILPVRGDNYQAICFPSHNIGYVVGMAGSILKTTDEGQTWTELQAPATLSLNGELRDVAFADDNTGFICGSNGLFWTTTNGGKTWKEVTGLPKVQLNTLAIKGRTAWIGGNNGTLIRFSF